MGGGLGLAAVPEILSGMYKNGTVPTIIGLVKHEDYFNADVMFIKTSFVKDNLENILNACKFVHDNTFYCAEQDALNILFSQKILKLPKKFNKMIGYFRRDSKIDLGEGIYHYTGGSTSHKPDLNTNDVYSKLYFEYFLKTPWADADMFGNIHRACEKLYNDSKINLLHFTNLVATRERAFLADANSMDAVSKVFQIKDTEKMFNASKPEDLEKFYADAEESHGKKIFFILSGSYFTIGRTLLQRNFVEGLDFVNAIMFLSKQHGVYIPFDSKPIVQEM